MPDYDVVIQNGTLYDGSGDPPRQADLAMRGGYIAAIGEPGTLDGATKIDANGLAVAPGFINMLSWSVESLIEDGRSQSELRQGVTLEVMGEGTSMGPYNEEMVASGWRGILQNRFIQYTVEWRTLGQYLDYLVKRGVSCNVASFVGSATLRVNAMGFDDRAPTPDEMDKMRALLREAMEEGAVGMSAALIYPPATYQTTEELIELAQVVADYGGTYISHIRSESADFLESLDELITISQVTGVQAEVYHLKAAGRDNWPKMDQAIKRITSARANGLPVSADMYLYSASGTGLAACIPPWAHNGGHEALLARLRDPETRERIKHEMKTKTEGWENVYRQLEGPDGALLAGFNNPALQPLTGKTLAEVAAMRATTPEDTLIDLLIEDGGHIFTIYFSMSEANIRKQIQQPWVSFCSDAESQAPEGVFLKANPHPRAYGNFARLLGRYVRDEQLIPLEEAIRRLTSLPAANLKLKRLGALKAGYHADVVIFDPAKVEDRATFDNPHQYAVGMTHVFVNGVQVIKDGEHTGAKPGRVVRGPGWKGDQ